MSDVYMRPASSVDVFPVEMWREVFAHAVFPPLLPGQNASVFDDIDVFGHPCKLYSSQLAVRTTLQLVCRLWYEIIKWDKKHGTFFMDTVSISEILLERVRLARRLEIINRWASYCCQWPCVLTRRPSGRCPSGTYTSPKYEQNAQGTIYCPPEASFGAEILRLLDDNRDASQLLNGCMNLRALSVRFTGFRLATSGTNFVQSHLQQLSHLHLDGVQDNGEINVLYLPRLRYLKLTMDLRYGGIGIFPLEIRMPNINTIVLEGWADSRYRSSIDVLLLSTTHSLINLILTYNGENGHAIFSLLNLPKFEKLSVFGFGIRNLYRELHREFVATPLPLSSSSISFALFGLDTHNRKDCFRFRKGYVSKLTDIFTRRGEWFSKLVIPLEWSDLQDLWVQACEKFDLGDGFSEDDPLPCYWYVLNHVSKSGVPVEDRNGVGMGEGAGAIFTRRMEEYSDSKEYTAKRSHLVRTHCKNWNSWDYRDDWVESDWSYK
ncbi:hypothetical protein FRC17_006568 [Serendipita sp. 399]|nr:hypothetical protein FRC17_006568 [Serendipita sp. 399]